MDHNYLSELNDYKQKVHTKVFVPEADREVVVKAPIVKWIDLQDGVGNLKLLKEYGETEVFPKGSNLVTNGGFETGDPPTGWTAQSSADLDRHSTSPHSGTYCLEINEDGTAYPAAYQDFTVSFGEVYELECYIKAGTEASYALELYNPVPGVVLDGEYSEATTSWVRHRLYTSIPSGCTTLRVILQQQCAKDSGTTLLFDDVKLYKLYGGFTISADQITVHSTDDGNTNATRVFETKEGETGERRVWVNNSINNERWHYDSPVEDYQFRLEVASGGMALESIGAIVGPSRRIN